MLRVWEKASSIRSYTNFTHNDNNNNNNNNNNNDALIYSRI